MANPVLRWQKSPSPTVTFYRVQWTLNGVNTGTGDFPQDATLDTAGYATAYLNTNPGAVLNPGDAVGVSIVAVDGVHNLLSAPVIPPPVTIPFADPEPPGNVTLSLV